MLTVTSRSLRRACYFLFTASGFAGLIYESVWTHYLKLVLGHAAYAQTLVLAIFMGGMAAGSWLASRMPFERSPSPLLAYALVEAGLALSALAFHSVYALSTHWLLESWIPQLTSSSAVALSKWSLCGALILPEAVLLGMTFPLLSVGVLRLSPRDSGETLATLYFTNSMGAVLGVLASGFVLIPALGLPGTVQVAGVSNALVALGVGLLARGAPQPPATPAAADSGFQRVELVFLGAACLTGLASFCYEIAWVRMLSMVLGSSVHAFELMLGTFILGLALGSLLVRRYIDRVADPARLSGYLQLAMGMLALSTLVLYGGIFEGMAHLVRVLPKTDTGYRWFNLGSGLLALMLMLPTTLVAGTTLPLFTHVLLRRGHGERSVGRVYAANTLGAIAGVLLAVHLALPQLGVRGVIAVGAGCDVALGLLLLLLLSPSRARRSLILIAATSGIFVLLLAAAPVNSARTAAGVFRTGQAQLDADTRVIFHRDGKTATIDVSQARSGQLLISTNGKPDAAANRTLKYGTTDELTVVAAAGFALAHMPEVQRIANIGFGSGMTTHVLLERQACRESTRSRSSLRWWRAHARLVRSRRAPTATRAVMWCSRTPRHSCPASANPTT